MSRKIRDVFTLDDIRNLKSIFLADAVKEFLLAGSSKLKADEKREALADLWAAQTRTRPNEPDDVIQAKGEAFETPGRDSDTDALIDMQNWDAHEGEGGNVKGAPMAARKRYAAYLKQTGRKHMTAKQGRRYDKALKKYGSAIL